MKRSKNNASESKPQTLPDEIVDGLIARIFLGEIKAGEQLQPSRALAEELRVDRTSLRIALRQLARMNVIRPLQGSGITVLDYREHGTIDFIATAFSLPDIDLGGAYLLEALELWMLFLPAIVAGAIKRATPADYQRIDLLLAEQAALIEQKADLEKVQGIELDVYSGLVRAHGSTLLMLIYNTALPVGRALVRMLFETVDAREHVEKRRELLRMAMAGKVADEEITAALDTLVQSEYQPLRDRLATLPISPSRKKRGPTTKPTKKSKKA